VKPASTGRGWVYAVGSGGMQPWAPREEKAMASNRPAGSVRKQLYAGLNSTPRALARRALNYLWPGLFFIFSLATVAAFALQAQ
jgi:hypothetical protein